MKVLSAILSLYIIILTAIPCIDVHVDDTMHKIEHSDNTTDNHQNEKDQCSPFCTCVCCASPVIYQPYIVQYNTFSFVKRQYTCYNLSFDSGLYTTIWQPPKIS